MDWVGAALVLAAVTCLVLALNWGGNTKPWGSAAVIVTLILGPILGIVTVLWERHIDQRAMVPVIMFQGSRRQLLSVLCIIAYAFGVRFSMLLYTYYLPIFYRLFDSLFLPVHELQVG